MKSRQDNDWEKSFKADMKVIEDVYQVHIPDERELLVQLHQFKEKQKKAFVREFAVFLITALMILAFYAVIAFKLTALFIWIQGIALFVFPLLLLIEHKQKQSENEVFRNGSE